MYTQWLTAICVAVLAAGARSASVPAQDIVVTSPKSPEPSQVSAQKPYVPIKLTEMNVNSEIALRYAHTSVVTHVTNPDLRPQEATFSMLLPDTAFISGFTMILDGKAYKAYVKEKEEAKKIYNEAVAQGISAAQVSTNARDSNQFTVSVNVEGNSTAIFDLRYEELLVRRNGLYNHDINLHPGNFVPKLKVVVHIKEQDQISTLRVPELRTGNDVDATEKDPQNQKAVIARNDDQQEVTITFIPDLDEQKRLAKIYLEKIKDIEAPNRYIGNKESKPDSTSLGQFVVQYDVNRPDSGEVIISDGYFAHFFAPISLYPLAKHMVFVLDTSGSMSGRKIDQLKTAMKTILSDLNRYDYFSLVEFNSIVTVHDLKNADQKPPKSPIYYPTLNSNSQNVTLVAPFIASPENIAKAKKIVDNLIANGGTNIFDALEVGLNLIQKGVVLDTEGKRKESTSQNKDCPCCNNGWDDPWYESEEIYNKLEPVIIFLTDGQPTVRETNPNRIIANITKKNSGDDPASIHSLAFGRDADSSFLRRLSLRNNGFMQPIYEAADAAIQLYDFYRQVSSPLLSNVQFHYSKQLIKEGTLSRSQYHIINAGSEVVVVGQLYEDAFPYEITPWVTGYYGSEDGLTRIPYEVYPRVTIECSDQNLPLERSWAYLTIKQLLDQRDTTDDDAEKKNIEKKALDLALKYEFVTPLTSLVVVKPNATNAVDLESSDKQPNYGSLGGAQFAASPSFVSNAGISRAAPSMSKQVARPASRPALPISKPAPAPGPAIAQEAQPSYDVSQQPAPQPTPVSPLADYHLENFGWTSAILDSSIGALVIEKNGSQITLALTKDVIAPKETSGDAKCSSVGANAGNVCVYLTRCYVARTFTVDEYRNSLCFIDNSYAGVCCPSNEVDKP